MFRFREFRTQCRNNLTTDIIATMQKCLDFDDLDSYFKACNYLSELINKNQLKLNKDLLNFLYEFPTQTTFNVEKLSSSRYIGIFIKNPDKFPIELISSINRIHFTPKVFLLGKNPDNSEFSDQLIKLDIAVSILDLNLEIAEHIRNLSTTLQTENISKIIIHANPADLDFLILSRALNKDLVSYHPEIPLLTNYSYCEQEGSLNKGSWKRNCALPLFEHFACIYVPNDHKIPNTAFELLEENKLLLLNNSPLECLSETDEHLIEKVVFINDSNEYSNGFKSCKEILVYENNLQVSLDYAFTYGLPIRFLEDQKRMTFSEVQNKYDLKSRFSNILANVYNTKTSFRKKLPRIVFFRNDSAAPIIYQINSNISAALKHAGCSVLDIDIKEMIVASHNKDWDRLKTIQIQTMDKIDHFSPDSALGYNDVGIFPNGDSHILEKRGIPYYGLFFDNPFFFFNNLEHCKNKNLISILTLDEYFIEPLKQGGFHQTYYLPIASSLHNNSAINQTSFDSEKFIFTSTIKPIRSAEQISEEVSDKNDREFIKYAFSEILDNEVYSLNTILANYKHFYSKDYKRFQNQIWFRIENQCSSQLRLQTINCLKNSSIDIYGGKNWENTELSDKHSFKGKIRYKELHKAYRQSLGTICRTPLNIQNGIQQRILDCGAARGLIISDYRPILEEHFELDKELFVYRNNEELKEKIKFLKNNPQAAELSKKLLHKKVLEQHTWDIRVQELINFMIN